MINIKTWIADVGDQWFLRAYTIGSLGDEHVYGTTIKLPLSRTYALVSKIFHPLPSFHEIPNEMIVS